MRTEIDKRIPIVVGVTGHRDVRPEDVPTLKASVKTVLKGLKEQCPNSPVVMLDSLAEGADQLCAEAALEENVPVMAALPMPLAEYEKDFEGDALVKFRSFIDAADEVFVTAETEPHRDDRDYLYRQSGLYIARHCHVLLALWNGMPGKPGGCGTAEVVDLKRDNAYEDLPESSLQPGGGAVIQIAMPRRGSVSGPEKPFEPAVDAITGEPTPAGEIIKLGYYELIPELESTDAFNKDAAGMDIANSYGLTTDETDPVSVRIDPVYRAANDSSVANAGRHKRIIAFLSIAATIITMAFLLYDEATLYWMILVCGFMIIALVVINKIALRTGYHRKYLEYRMLAEGLRVQSYLRHAGSPTEVFSILPWSWQMNTPWIRSALAVLTAGAVATEKRPINEIWIKDQLEYHKKARIRTEKTKKRNDRIVRVCLILSIIAYVFALVFEIAWGGLFSGQPALPAEKLELIRTWLKLILGSLSAATLFAGNYYGKLSLDQVIEDHVRMIDLYEFAARQIEASGETPELLIKTAKEELGENSSWYAYQNMNGPDVSL